MRISDWSSGVCSSDLPEPSFAMRIDDKIYVTGHRGLVGGAIFRALKRSGFTNIVARTHGELDLTDGSAVAQFFQTERPKHVFMAAARVGGIHANSVCPADFIRSEEHTSELKSLMRIS